MRPVDAVEAEMGSTETWPTYILVIIFAFDAHKPGALFQMMAIAFFMTIYFLQIWPANSLQPVVITLCS